MDFDKLLELVGDDPIFESSLLLAGDVDPRVIRLQLSRWVKTGRIYQIRRGVYAVAPPYQKLQPHPFHIANHLQAASYVSLQSALAYYGLIPEVVFSTTSVSTGRPERLNTPFGVFEFRHIKPAYLFGYQMINLGKQTALIALPEKALLDLIYLQPRSTSSTYLDELRLQNTDQLNLTKLNDLAEKFRSPKMKESAEMISVMVAAAAQEYEDL